MKEAFAPHGFMLTAAVSAGKSTMDTGYDVPAMSRSISHFILTPSSPSKPYIPQKSLLLKR